MTDNINQSENVNQNSATEDMNIPEGNKPAADAQKRTIVIPVSKIMGVIAFGEAMCASVLIDQSIRHTPCPRFIKIVGRSFISGAMSGLGMYLAKKYTNAKEMDVEIEIGDLNMPFNKGDHTVDPVTDYMSATELCNLTQKLYHYIRVYEFNNAIQEKIVANHDTYESVKVNELINAQQFENLQNIDALLTACCKIVGRKYKKIMKVMDNPEKFVKRVGKINGIAYEIYNALPKEYRQLVDDSDNHAGIRDITDDIMNDKIDFDAILKTLADNLGVNIEGMSNEEIGIVFDIMKDAINESTKNPHPDIIERIKKIAEMEKDLMAIENEINGIIAQADACEDPDRKKELMDKAMELRDSKLAYITKQISDEFNKDIT